MVCPKKPPVTRTRLPLTALLIGASGSIGLAVKWNGAYVSCSAGRLAGYQSNVTKADTVAFDWKRFWKYLKPHLLKFLAAICVSAILVFSAIERV